MLFSIYILTRKTFVRKANGEDTPQTASQFVSTGSIKDPNQNACAGVCNVCPGNFVMYLTVNVFEILVEYN